MPTIRFHLRNPRQAVKGGMFAAFAVFIEAASVMDSARASLIPPTLIAAGILALAYVFYLRPYVTLDDAGITLGNWIRTVRIPWREYEGRSSKLGLHILSETGSDAVACYPRSAKRSEGGIRRPGLSERRLGLSQRQGGSGSTRDSDGAAGSPRQPYRRPEPALRPKADLQWATPLQAGLAIDSAHRDATTSETAGGKQEVRSGKQDSPDGAQNPGGREQYSRRFSPVPCLALAAGLLAIAEGVRQAVSG